MWWQHQWRQVCERPVSMYIIVVAHYTSQQCTVQWRPLLGRRRRIYVVSERLTESPEVYSQRSNEYISNELSSCAPGRASGVFDIDEWKVVRFTLYALTMVWTYGMERAVQSPYEMCDAVNFAKPPHLVSIGSWHSAAFTSNVACSTAHLCCPD